MNKRILYLNHLRQIVNPILLRSLLIILLFRTGVSAEMLTLEESISEALENNPSITAAMARIQEAGAEKGKALSNFFPKIYASSFYMRLDEEREIELPSFGESIPFSSDEIYGYSLSLTQTLFTGGKITSLYRMQSENLEASEKQFEKVRNDLVFGVKESYFRVLESEKLRKVAEEAAVQVGAHLEVIENFFREGMVPEVDVLRSKVTLANAKQNLINAENGVRLSKFRFNSLLNRDMGLDVSLEDVLSFEDLDFDLPSLIGEAFANRPEMLELGNRLKMAEQGVRIARSDFFPHVAFVGNWDNRKGEEIPVDEWEESWNATVQVSVDIWDWGENRNEHRRAKAELTQLESRFLLLKNEIELEVRRAYLVLLAAKDKIKVQEEAVKSAEKNSRDTSLRFKEGVAANTDVLDAQTMFSQSRTDYYRALYGYNLALAALERAVGKGSSTL